VAQDDISRYEHAVAWFTTEHQVMIAVLEVAATTGFDTHIWRLAWALAPFLDRYGHWNDLHNTQSTALATVLRARARQAEPNARRLLGLAHLRQSRYEDAHRQLRQALNAFQDNDDHTQQAHTHLKISTTYQRQGRTRPALHHAEQCLRLHQHTDNQVGQATALNAIGWCNALLGDYTSALVYCRQALELLTKHGDIHGQALTWNSLGHAHHHLDNPRQAVSSYQHALRLHRRLGDRYHEAQTLIHLGNTHHSATDLTAAREAWRHALAIFSELDHPDTARIRTQLGSPPYSTTAMIELVRGVDDEANSARMVIAGAARMDS
jgi:tetratricopeptide (TPR) repeat protein